jgi:hypothetical protein
MGILDRTSYSTPKAIPQSWAMTTLDPARIEARKQTLILQSSSQNTNDIIENPSSSGLLKEQKLPITTISGNSGSLVPTPAPKKRFVLLHLDLTC